MPFVRFSRDKRGYEHLYLVASITHRGKSRNRILYWYRTPPGIKVGRLPFDGLVRRTLEAQHPEMAFDWQQLIDTPMPPPAPDVERWRERRRAEKAAKQAAATEVAAEAANEASEEESPAEGPASITLAEAVEIVPPAAAPDVGTPAGSARRRRRRRGGLKKSASTAEPGDE